MVKSKKNIYKSNRVTRIKKNKSTYKKNLSNRRKKNKKSKSRKLRNKIGGDINDDPNFKIWQRNYQKLRSITGILNSKKSKPSVTFEQYQNITRKPNKYYSIPSYQPNLTTDAYRNNNVQDKIKGYISKMKLDKNYWVDENMFIIRTKRKEQKFNIVNKKQNNDNDDTETNKRFSLIEPTYNKPVNYTNYSVFNSRKQFWDVKPNEIGKVVSFNDKFYILEKFINPNDIIGIKSRNVVIGFNSPKENQNYSKRVLLDNDNIRLMTQNKKYMPIWRNSDGFYIFNGWNHIESDLSYQSIIDNVSYSLSYILTPRLSKSTLLCHPLYVDPINTNIPNPLLNTKSCIKNNIHYINSSNVKYGSNYIKSELTKFINNLISQNTIIVKGSESDNDNSPDDNTDRSSFVTIPLNNVPLNNHAKISKYFFNIIHYMNWPFEDFNNNQPLISTIPVISNISKNEYISQTDNLKQETMLQKEEKQRRGSDDSLVMKNYGEIRDVIDVYGNHIEDEVTLG